MNPLPPPPNSTGGMPPPPLGSTSPPGPAAYNPGYAPMPVAPSGGFATARPRPKSPTGSLLLIIGAVLLVVSAYLPWYTNDAGNLTGTDTFYADYGSTSIKNPGLIWVVIGVILFGLGVAAFFAGRQIALAIVSIVFAAIGVFMAIAGFGIVKNEMEFLDLIGAPATGHYGVGIYLSIVAAVIALAGSIVVMVKRRR